MPGTLKLSFDVVNQTLVSWQGSTTRLEFGQTAYACQIRLVEPATTFSPNSPAYTAFDDTDYDGIRLGIWSDSTGTLSDSATYVLALTPHTGFTKNIADSEDPFWEGTLNCYTQQVADFVQAASGNKTRAAYLACNLVSGSTLTRVFDHRAGATNCTLNSATDDGSGDLPVDMTTAIPTVTLPWHFRDAASGEIYALSRTSAGVVEFVWVNP
jgi:hypothetical protein